MAFTSGQVSGALSGISLSYPYTQSIWINGNTNYKYFMGIGTNVWNTGSIGVGTRAGKTLRMTVSDVANADLANAFIEDSWSNVIIVANAANDFDLHGQGNTKSLTSGTTSVPLDYFGFGGRNGGDDAAGWNEPAGEGAIWSVALDASEIAALSAGYSALLVRPASLEIYIPGVRGLTDIVAATSLTEQRSPTVSTHPPIIYPSRPQIGVAAGGAPPAGDAMPEAMHHYRSRRAC